MVYRVLLLTTKVKVPSTDVITPNCLTPEYENDKRNGESNLFFSLNDRVYSRRDSPTAGMPVKQVTRKTCALRHQLWLLLSHQKGHQAKSERQRREEIRQVHF